MANEKEQRDVTKMTVGERAHDPLENFRKYKCLSGHSNWNAKNVIFIMDHQAHAVECLTCKKVYFIHIGMAEVHPAPRGWASDMGVEED